MPEFKPRFTATGIGTLPYTDPAQAVDTVLAQLTEMPYWPQLPARSHLEDMNSQYAPALTPLLVVGEAGQVRANPATGREEALAGFYERLFSGQSAGFGLTEKEAAGFIAFLQRIGRAAPGEFPWVKGHVTGPCTLAASVTGWDGKALLYDDEVAEALARGLGAAAAAQVEQMAPLGRPVLIFFDEPFLSGFGSAFSPISRERVIELLGYSFEETRNRCQAQIGVHCCGNTDWAMIVESGTDVINLDSAGFGRHLLLYDQAVRDFYARGGVMAWGAVPTAYTGVETAEELWAALAGLLKELESWGLSRSMLADQALITPACGLGTRGQDEARTILQLTRQVSELARSQYV